MIIDGLLDRFTALERGELFRHEVEVLLLGVQGGEPRNLATLPVIGMVVVKADNSSEVRHQGVGLPATWLPKAAAQRSHGAAPKDVG